jgi:hypothetical protein
MTYDSGVRGGGEDRVSDAFSRPRVGSARGVRSRGCADVGWRGGILQYDKNKSDVSS